MQSIFTEAIERSTSIVETYRKAAARMPRQQALPDFGGRLTSKPDSYGYGQSNAEKYRYFRAWTYACIHCIADRVANLNWEAAEVTNAEENPERSARLTMHKRCLPQRLRYKAAPTQELNAIASHPVLDLLAKPNALQRKYEFLYFTVANLELTGEAFWLIGADDDDKTQEQLFAVPATWMRWNKDQKVYMLRIGGGSEEVPVPAEFVARMYFPNPSDPRACYSPLSACYSAVRVDDYIQRSQSQAFEIGIHPNLIVTLGKDPATNQRPYLQGHQRRQYIRAIRELWSQTVNLGDPVVLDSLIESVHKLHATPQEMDWPASGQIVKDRIMQTFRVNPFVLGHIENVNKAQAVVAEQTFYSQVVNPIGGAISDTATEFLGPRYESPKRLLVFLEQAVSEDPDQQLRTWSTLRRNDDVTQDEIRQALLGLPPLEGRDEPSKLVQLVGGFSGLMSLLQQVNYGLIDVDQALAVLTRFMRLSEEDARQIIGRPKIRRQPEPLGGGGLPALPAPSFGGGGTGEEAFSEATLKAAIANLGAESDPDVDEDKATRRKEIEAIRVKQYEDAADELQTAVQAAFADVVGDIISQLGKGWTPDPDNADDQAAELMDEAVDADAIRKHLMEAAVPPVMKAFGAGVEQQREETKHVREQHKAHRPRRRKMLQKPTTAEEFAAKYDLDIPELEEIVEEFQFSMRMPEKMLDEAFDALDKAFSHEAWQEGIAASTRDDIENTLYNAIKQGKSIREIRDELMEKHGDEYTKARATNVARTESSNMLNAGHSAGIEELAEETGLDIGKEWLSVLGSTTRDSHAALHGTLADENGMFDLDGVLIPYPGHPDLPPENRCQCQCSVVSSIL